MAQNKCTNLKVGKDGKSSSTANKPTVPSAGFSIPSQKSVLDYFHATPSVQKMYAERVLSEMREFIAGRTKLYPSHLNTSSHIADFIFNNRSCKINSTDTLAEDFLGLCIRPTPLQSKRKRDKEEMAEVASKVKALPAKKVEPKAVATGVKSKPVKVAPAEPVIGKFNIGGRPRKQLGFPLVSIPNFLTFFPNPRVAVFSSKGGLHDSSCKICYEVGFYTAVDSTGVRRKLDLGQKAWVSTLHDLVDHEGFIPEGDRDRLLAVQRSVDKPVEMAVAEKAGIVSIAGSEDGCSDWTMPVPEGERISD